MSLSTRSENQDPPASQDLFQEEIFPRTPEEILARGVACRDIERQYRQHGFEINYSETGMALGTPVKAWADPDPEQTQRCVYNHGPGYDLWFSQPIYCFQQRPRSSIKPELDLVLEALRESRYAQYIVVAGGSILNYALAPKGLDSRTYIDCSDIDLFLVGVSDPTLAESILNDITDRLVRSHFRTGVLCILNNARTREITGSGFKLKIQITRRLNPSVAHLLLGFDLGCCQVAIDLWGNLWTTPLGQFSLDHGAIMVDLTRQSPSFDYRLVKYGRRGFSWVMPELDHDRFRHENLIQMGRLLVKLSDPSDRSHIPGRVIKLPGTPQYASDYQETANLTLGLEYSSTIYWAYFIRTALTESGNPARRCFFKFVDPDRDHGLGQDQQT